MSKTNLGLRTRTYKKLIDEVKTPDYWNEASATEATKKKKKTSNKQIAKETSDSERELQLNSLMRENKREQKKQHKPTLEEIE